MLVEMCIEVYGKYVVYENRRKVIYVEVLRDLYGMLVAYLLWYNKFHSDIEEISYELNPYDPCVDNQMVKNKQHAASLHVDDLMISYID